MVAPSGSGGPADGTPPERVSCDRRAAALLRQQRRAGPDLVRLRRAARAVLVVQAVGVGALGVAGLVTEAVEVAGFRVTSGFAVLLVLTAVAGASAAGLARRRPRAAGRIVLAQIVVHTVAYVAGASIGLGPRPGPLNTPDLVLSAGLALVGFVVFSMIHADLLHSDPSTTPTNPTTPAGSRPDRSSDVTGQKGSPPTLARRDGE